MKQNKSKVSRRKKIIKIKIKRNRNQKHNRKKNNKIELIFFNMNKINKLLATAVE